MIEREWELVEAKAMAKGKDDRKGMGIGRGKLAFLLCVLSEKQTI